MNRQGSGPGRGTHGRSGDAAYADRDAYQRDPYLEPGAFPVDPGYAGSPDYDQPRPADLPPGPWRGRPERAASGEGYPAAHNAEQNRIVTTALDLSVPAMQYPRRDPGER